MQNEVLSYICRDILEIVDRWKTVTPWRTICTLVILGILFKNKTLKIIRIIQNPPCPPYNAVRKNWLHEGRGGGLESHDLRRKFKDFWFAWLNKENDSTWLGLEIEGLETWPSWLGRTWLYNNSNYYYKSLRHNLLNTTQATEAAAEVIRVCAVNDTARAQEHSAPNTGSKRISYYINTLRRVMSPLHKWKVCKLDR